MCRNQVSQLAIIMKLAKPCNEAMKKIAPKWEWRPEYRDACVYADYRDIFTVLSYGKRYDQVKIIGDEGCSSWEHRKNLIPILDWQKIEQILEGFGYHTLFTVEGFDRRGYEFIIITPKGRTCSASAKKRQPAVMRAVIELSKKVG